MCFCAVQPDRIKIAGIEDPSIFVPDCLLRCRCVTSTLLVTRESELLFHLLFSQQHGYRSDITISSPLCYRRASDGTRHGRGYDRCRLDSRESRVPSGRVALLVTRIHRKASTVPQMMRKSFRHSCLIVSLVLLSGSMLNEKFREQIWVRPDDCFDS